MINLKLKTIASLINKDNIVLDMACDHAYLAIYLKENNLCKEVYASDISNNAINSARNNILKANLKIKTYLSDGFKNIDLPDIDTVVISGVGTSTIINILNNSPSIKNYILSSNNNHEELRYFMYNKGYYNKKEIVIKEHNKFYPIILFTKEKQKETKLSLKYGKSNNQEYFNYLINKEKEIIKNIPKTKFILRYNHLKEIANIKKILKERKLDY